MEVPPIAWSQSVLGRPEPFRKPPLAANNNITNPDNVLRHVDIPSAVIPFMGSNKWGGVIRFTERGSELPNFRL
jgi:hypothetical protein